MRLNNFTDYALRVLIYLALKEDERSTVAEISRQYAISNNHLVKVVHKLSQLNVIESFKGKGGGILLRTSAKNINIGQIIQSFEQGSYLLDCFKPEGSCKINPICKLKSIVADAEDSFYKVFDEYTLADLVKNKTQLKARLF